MKKRLFALLLVAPCLFWAQDSNEAGVKSSEADFKSQKFTKFNNQAKQFNDWSIGFGGGAAFLHRSDLTSFNKDGKHFGWNGYVELNKQMSDKFAFILQYQMGETTQTARLGYNTWGLPANAYGLATAKTKFKQISLMGDFNFSNLFRRIDNATDFKTALHGYAGIGFNGYDYTRMDEKPLTTLPNGTKINETFRAFKQPINIATFFYQVGLGVKYRLTKRVDLEARAMYVITGDDEFDGGGETTNEWPGYNQRINNNSDNLVSANIGVSFKLGKHKNHLGWYDAGNTVIQKMSVLNDKSFNTDICTKGDKDKDGVCDDWDRELNTLEGARVDGAGVALDMDQDGIIDLNDKCVTIAGLAQFSGCPRLEEESFVINEETTSLESIEFDLNQTVIRPQSFEKLDRVAEIIKKSNNSVQFTIIGGTDARSSAEYNLRLSQERANAVKNYLINKGVNPNMLVTEGRGAQDLKYPECNPATKCPEWKNEANRRVYFETK